MRRPLDDGARGALLALTERQLTAAEVDAYLARPMTEDEVHDVLDQVRWFTRRYPTGAERLAYARRAYRRWTRRV